MVGLFCFCLVYFVFLLARSIIIIIILSYHFEPDNTSSDNDHFLGYLGNVQSSCGRDDSFFVELFLGSVILNELDLIYRLDPQKEGLRTGRKGRGVGSDPVAIIMFFVSIF